MKNTQNKILECGGSKGGSLESSGADVGVDTTFALTSDESNITLLTPRGVPGVLDDPVVFATFFAITDEGDTVVEFLGVTEEWVHDTGPVGLEP